MTDTPKKVPLHLSSWAAQDWLTSRVRMRSIQTNDPWLRVVYLDALNLLQEAGGVLAHDIDALSDKLGVPVAEVERCLPILDKMARSPGSRGGLIIEDGTVRNLRVSQAFEQAAAYAQQQAEFGKQGGKGRPKTTKPKGAIGHPKGTPGPPCPEGTPGVAQGLPNLPLPLPLPLPLSVAVPVPVAVGERSGVAGEGAGGDDRSPPRTHATHAVSPGGAPEQPNNGDGDVTDTGTTDTGLRTAIDHDPDNELQAAIVDRCVHLAKVDAWREDRQPTTADVLGILHVVSTTPTGVHLEGLRHASQSWLDQTLRASEVFERENFEGDRAPPE